MLTTSRNQFINIKDEVNYLNLYVELENLRQNNRFTYSISVSGSIDQVEAEIPVMLVQPHVENAIKQGLALKENGGFSSLMGQNRLYFLGIEFHYFRGYHAQYIKNSLMLGFTQKIE